jgi:hypothetical protein
VASIFVLKSVQLTGCLSLTKSRSCGIFSCSTNEQVSEKNGISHQKHGKKNNVELWILMV